MRLLIPQRVKIRIPGHEAGRTFLSAPAPAYTDPVAGLAVSGGQEKTYTCSAPSRLFVM